MDQLQNSGGRSQMGYSIEEIEARWKALASSEQNIPVPPTPKIDHGKISWNRSENAWVNSRGEKLKGSDESGREIYFEGKEVAFPYTKETPAEQATSFRVSDIMKKKTG